MTSFPIIEFSQYESSTDADDLYMFAAPAREIAKWAGIPRKGWRIRMLFQRWITESRKTELIEFWNRASEPIGEQRYIVGPTAIVIAIQDAPVIEDGRISLAYTPKINLTADPAENLANLAKEIFPSVFDRLEREQKDMISEFCESPLTDDLPDVSHDYVYEFAFQLAQMKADSRWFAEKNGMSAEETSEVVEALEALSRPAIVVDGQHRLWGASKARKPIWLPVVAYAKAKWTDQIYQFIVINEKAKPIEPSLLTDIFGSSLTRQEQQEIRKELTRGNVEVESRIAAVIAGRDSDSPFFNMVKLKVETALPDDVKPYINDKIVRDLISSGGGARGWRSDEDYYEKYVQPTIPKENDWNAWTDGAWRRYWFAFWQTVRDYYNDLHFQEHGSDENYEPLWSETQRSNLTKGVTLKTLQNLFMERAVSSISELESTEEILVQALGEQEAQTKMAELLEKKAIPAKLDLFQEQIKELLLKFIPLKVFTADWETSLDDQSGREHLSSALSDIINKVKKNRGWQLRWYPNVFIAKTKDES